ncbi:C-GCAxxG-C-C family protein [Mariniphaga sp.]|uniref:C-GCAxxG-C-C family protein n=1 Tax=Mariniphaga sp. TaxID=1954475 RepID=UPI003569CD67
MTKKSALVEKQFSQFNCAQTVFSLFAKDLGLDEKTALKISSGFGGGMNCAETCGAVTGSYMVIGMKHGHFTSDPKAKTKTKLLMKQFNEKFKAAHKSLICKELTGYDISTPEGAAAANAERIHDTRCTKFIKTACDILEEGF